MLRSIRYVVATHMKGTVTLLRQIADPQPAPPGRIGQRLPRPLEVVVPYTNPALTAHAFSEALRLAADCSTTVTLMAVHVLPYPAPLECQEGIRKRLEAELAAVARTAPAEARVKLVFARNREDAYLGLLPRHVLVVIGVKARWWRTREERLARTLAASGHSVAVIKVR